MKRRQPCGQRSRGRRSLSEKGEQGPCFGQGAHLITSLRGVYSQHRKRRQIEAAAKEHLAPFLGAGFRGAARVASRQERAMNPVEIARRLGVRLASIEAVCLSHWHADHSGGLPGVVAAITRSRLDEGLPPPIVDLHPDRPDQRGTMTPAGTLVLLNPEPTFEAIESAGGRVTKHAEAHVLAGFFFISGEIERVTSYEAGFVGHHTLRDGHTVPDPLILDERFLAARVRGRGVSVLSPCSHAGVVNAALGALGAFGGEPIDVILGGYHLAGQGMESRIEPTVHDLAKRVRPRVVAPGHCTGWRAKAALAHTFAPGNYGPSVVGSLYALRARCEWDDFAGSHGRTACIARL